MTDQLPNLPLFPLPIVLLPGDLVPLHIFEQQFRDMMADCLDESKGEDGGEFVICLCHEDETRSTGCAARIVEVVQTYDDGRMDIMVQGTRRVVVRETFASSSYSTVAVDNLDDVVETVDPALQQEVLDLGLTYLGLAQGPSGSPTSDGSQPTSYRVAGETIADVLLRQNLLELTSELERLAYLQRYFRKAIPRLRKIEQINNQVKTNGHFKGFPSVEE